MAYNLQSLITILQQILNPEETRWIPFQNIPQLQSLLQKAESLQQILEKSSLTKIKGLENQIRDAAHRAEDIIEPLMVDQILSLPQGISFISLAPDVEQVTQELDNVMKQVVKLGEGNKMTSGSSSSGISFSSSKSVVVGVDKDLMQLKDRLTGMERKLEIIPIVGMGGIGKTTLARKLYQDPLIVEHFQCLAWTTISQDYNMKAILSSLLRCIIGKEFDDQHIGKESDELRDVLYRSLYGRRFMIVLDDIWSTKFWDEIRVYLPDNNNGSRIVITTRELDVAKYADSRSLVHQVNLLDQSKSWDLLRQLVFGSEEDFLDDVLQEIGEKIVIDCGGLPLAINVIGGVLAKVERSRDAWENIGNDVRAAIAKKDEQCSSILSLSYNHLPNQLRPCFLYMGAAFPEDYEIKRSKLIHMWVAEGFVKSNGDKSLEEEAEDYLKSLVERNLIFIKELKFNGKPHILSMHDLLRDLCISIAIEDKFLHVKHAPNVFTVSSNMRRVCFDASYSPHRVYDSTEMMPHVRSFVRIGRLEIPSPVLSAFRLLRVLDIIEMRFGEFPRQVLQLVNLRYLAICCDLGNTPIGISRLCNLQTLIGEFEGGDMPSEIWEMSELRHIKLYDVMILFEEDVVMKKQHVLKKLQTLYRVLITGSPMWKDFFESIPNIKKLGIFCSEEWGGELDLSHLHKLEKLLCTYAVVSTIRFPSSLGSLTLDVSYIRSRELSTLCDLPNLEALTISNSIFEIESEEKEDGEWELAEDDVFPSLRSLHLGYCSNLVHWRADETNFPLLRHLSITMCENLEEIPSAIGEIPTLQLIELHYCSATVVASAEQILEVQQSDYGNYDLQLRINEARSFEYTDSE